MQNIRGMSRAQPQTPRSLRLHLAQRIHDGPSDALRVDAVVIQDRTGLYCMGRDCDGGMRMLRPAAPVISWTCQRLAPSAQR